MDDPVLVVDGLTRRFGQVVVLSGVSFALRAGRTAAVVGPNGAGKTTLLRCVVGADRPDEGRVLIGGRPLRETGPAMRHRVLRLAPRYATSAAGTAAFGAAIAWLSAVVTEPADAPWWPVTGAGVAAGLWAAAVLLQTGRAVLGRVAATGLVGLGAVLAVVALVAPRDPWLPTLPTPAIAVAVVYRTATRLAPDYGATVFETGFGAVPVDLLRQLLRGPALLTVLVAAQLLLAS